MTYRDSFHWKSQVSCFYYPHFTWWFRLNWPLQVWRAVCLTQWIALLLLYSSLTDHVLGLIRYTVTNTEERISVSLLLCFEVSSFKEVLFFFSYDYLAYFSGYQETGSEEGERLSKCNFPFIRRSSCTVRTAQPLSRGVEGSVASQLTLPGEPAIGKASISSRNHTVIARVSP